MISKPGDVDFFKFAGKQGQVFDVRVFARQLGLAAGSADQRAQGRRRRRSPATTTAAAPTATSAFTLPDDGEYLVSISDQLRQGGVDYVYRIEVTPVVPGLTLGLPERQQYVDTTLAVPQGNRLAALVSAQRVDFGGDLQLDFKDLPPGVSVETFPMAANRTDVPVLLTAAEGTALTAGLVDLVGIVADPNQPIEGRLPPADRRWCAGRTRSKSWATPRGGCRWP